MSQFTPYLQLGDRLSQIWINKYTLVLLLALFKLLFFYFSIGNELNLSKQYILNHCNTIDSLYSNVTTNTPHYLGLMGNYLVDKTMEESVKATLTLLSLLVYASEELMTFVIDLYLGTYACLIVSAIDGTVDIATNTTEKLIGVVNNTVSSFANDLDDGLDDVSKVINKILHVASKVEDFFTDDDDDDGNAATNNIHKVNLTISALRNVYIPSSINDKLEELSAKTPDFATVKNDTKKLIAVPFQAIRKEIKQVDTSKIIGNGTSLLYVPPKEETVSSNPNGICSSNKPTIEKIYTNMGKNLKVVTIILMVLFVVGAFVVMIPEAWKEMKQWTRLKQLQENCVDGYDQYSYFTSEEEETEGEDNLQPAKTKGSLESDKIHVDRYEPMDAIESYQRCFQVWQTRISDFVVYILTMGRNLSVLQKRKIQWFASYITSERALFVLAIGLLGIIVSVFQLIILAVLQKQIHKAHQLQSKFANSSEMEVLKKDLTTWTKQTNTYIQSTENNINTQIFGWVETSTTSINNTVTTMIKDIDTTLADIFNGTLLYHPMTTVVKCVIEDKLYAVERAMTWIHDKAQVSFPQINSTDIVNLVKNNNNTSTANITSTASSPERIMQSFVKEIHTMLTTIERGFHRTVVLELIISAAITGIWALQIPIALIILLCKQRHQQT